MEKLTSSEREEIETLSILLTGRSSAWQTMLKRGFVESALDEEGKPVLHNGTPVSRVIYKTEREVLQILRDMKQKKELIERAQKEIKERSAKEQEIRRQMEKATGSVGGGLTK